MKWLWTLALCASCVVSSIAWSRPIVLSPDGVAVRALGGSTCCFDDKGDLYLFRAQTDSSGLTVYNVSRVPLDGSPLEAMGPWQGVSLWTPLPLGGIHMFAVGETFYIPRESIGMFYVLTWTGAGPLQEVAQFKNPMRGRRRWLLDEKGNLVYVRIYSALDWEIRRFNVTGPISEESYHFEPDPDWTGSWGNLEPTLLEFLPNGTILCATTSGFSTEADLLDAYGRTVAKGKPPPQPFREWFVYRVFDPESQKMVRHGTHRLSEVSFGEVKAWFGGKPWELVARDSTGVSILIEGGDRLPDNPPADQVDTRLYLLHFTPDGTLLTPETGKGRSHLRLVETPPASPIKRMIRPIPYVVHPTGRGEFRILDIDADGNLSITDYLKPSE